MTDLRVYCAEIGSVAKGNFAWYGGSALNPSDRKTGSSIEEMAVCIAEDINKGFPVALGFECPLFVLVPDDPIQLTTARPGEGNRPWSANAGASALATGLTEVTWILRAIRSKLQDSQQQGFLNWETFEASAKGLFLWEAFVTGAAKGGTHVADAMIAVNFFVGNLPDPTVADVMAGQINPGIAYSLIGAALLWSGWTEETSVLSRPCIVLKA